MLGVEESGTGPLRKPVGKLSVAQWVLGAYNLSGYNRQFCRCRVALFVSICSPTVCRTNFCSTSS